MVTEQLTLSARLFGGAGWLLWSSVSESKALAPSGRYVSHQPGYYQLHDLSHYAKVA